jgi:hypothetical protein
MVPSSSFICACVVSGCHWEGVGNSLGHGNDDNVMAPSLLICARVVSGTAPIVIVVIVVSHGAISHDSGSGDVGDNNSSGGSRRCCCHQCEMGWGRKMAELFSHGEIRLRHMHMTLFG